METASIYPVLHQMCKTYTHLPGLSKDPEMVSMPMIPINALRFGCNILAATYNYIISRPSIYFAYLTVFFRSKPFKKSFMIGGADAGQFAYRACIFSRFCISPNNVIT